MPRRWWYPDESDIDLIIDTLLNNLTQPGGARPLAGRVRDRGLLASALGVPQQPYHRTTIDKGAALFRSMVKNHAFADGNKRIGALVALLFLERNGYAVVATNEALIEFTLSLAASEPAVPLSTVAQWIRLNTVAPSKASAHRAKAPRR